MARQANNTYGMQKAKLVNLDGGGEVEFMFRPKEYQFSKTNSWQAGKAVGMNMNPPTFQGGQPMTLNLELFFDTYETGEDVRSKTQGLWNMMKITPKRIDSHTKKGSPPHVQFVWGQVWQFTAVITQMSQKFTLFLPNGVPVRSTVTIALQQAEEAGKYTSQNPTSGGPPGLVVHTVTEGETIDWIAYQEYGDANAWRHLAQINNLDDPAHLQPGQQLVIEPIG